jgi:hypothetical protein
VTPLTYPNALLVVLVFFTGAATAAISLHLLFRRWLRGVVAHFEGDVARMIVEMLAEHVPGFHNAVALWARRNLVHAVPPDPYEDEPPEAA